ncbi:TrkH family potassium uptake protein [Neisseria sp. Ec49-e6-T10]|uniref:TrkH family potassium uptake protein n=1 Tax=Neisseria sp. Ec49-e6-T10 TaxID=3140744 RepID=UPI003EC03063
MSKAQKRHQPPKRTFFKPLRSTAFNVKYDFRHKLYPILHALSKLGLLFSAILLLPALVSYIYDDGLLHTYLTSSAFAALITASTWIITQKYQRELKPRDGITFVVLLWIIFALVACLPFYIHFPYITFTDAFFESISGLTTTGATIMTGLDSLAPSLNFWRHFLNWIGGMGIIILAVAIFPLLGLGGVQLYKGEMPGFQSDNNKLAPQITKIAKHLWFVYVFLTFLCILSLKLAGMNWLDAVCHALSTLSLGGFSTHDHSIAYFDSVAIEMVLCVFMLLAIMNFTTHFFAFKTKKLSFYKNDQEAKYAFAILFTSIILAALYLWLKNIYSFSESFRHVFFNYVSIGTTAGFMGANYTVWPPVIALWMLFLGTFISGSGSTGGGIKMARAIVLFKFSVREMILLLHPNAVRTVKINNSPVSERMAFSTLAFIFVYFITIILFSFALMLSDLDFFSSFSAAISCITNNGTGLGIIDATHNFASLTAYQKWVCMLAMLMGRMEIFTILILFTPAYWRK